MVKIYFVLLIIATAIANETNLMVDQKESKASKDVTLSGWREYIINIAQDFVNELEEYGLCRHLLPEFNQTIDREFFGYNLKGNITYKNGFIGNMEEASYRNDTPGGPADNIDEDNHKVSISIPVTFTSLNMFYDYHIEIEPNIIISGTVAISYPAISFTLKVEKDLKYNTLDGSFACCDGNILTREWFYEPANDYTAIFNRNAQLDIVDDLNENYAKKIWKDLLHKVIGNRSFPEICFYCT